MATIYFCSKYLLGKIGFYYVMPGKFQSDPTEGRFGWFRQMHGGNLYISVRQLFDSERRIRAMSLTQFSHYGFDELNCSNPMSAIDEEVADTNTNTNTFIFLQNE